ncbi:AbrB family transcriptional regulator [Marinactinospora rubrisoli]|uniref:AbrB family transcriptional regulator n=1 Tax=Marinactinospora rubrisoli TaxID=2715399 RepID=A0ABW2KG00_9ACTN
MEALHMREGDEIEFISAGRDAVPRDPTVVATDQAWFWDRGWQAGERAASEQIARGRAEEYPDAESMFDALEEEG